MGRIQRFHVYASDTALTYHCERTSSGQIKLVQNYEKKHKNKFDPKINMVKYLELIDQNKIGLVLTLPQKCAKLLKMHLFVQF